MFDNHWNAKLVDFGFVTEENDGVFSTTFCGSPSYTAPELTKRQKYHSEMIDVWCLGVTLYAMLVGKLPFDGKSTKGTEQNIMDIKYELKNSFSNDAKMIFKQIFVPDLKRASIEDL
jgi:serine/threonine protein kinase